MKKILMICLPFAATVAWAQKTDESAKYAALITPDALKAKLSIVASAEMEGRETASPGQKRAAAYIESQFRSFGLKPGNGDSYQQVYPVYQDEITEKSLRVNGQTYAFDKDFSVSSFGAASGKWHETSLIYAGEGRVDAANGIDDYKGLDVKGKIVLLLPNTDNTGGGRRAMMAGMTSLRQKGAAGVLMISQNFPSKEPTNTKGRMSLNPPRTQGNGSSSFLYASVSDNVASALLGRTHTLSYDELKAIHPGEYYADIDAAVTVTTNQLESSNVIGVLPGTDKKDEYVFLTGHYDHLGKVGNTIWYGADDDGSGTVSVIQMAEAFSAAAKQGHRPRRTMIFMTVSGEEKGLLGSEYYSEHPTVDLSKASADLNTDMDGRIDTERKLPDTLNYIYVIGHDKLSSDLPIINEGVNNKYTHLTLDYKFDDPNDKERIYYRSDHYNFAKKGVPILFFYDGMLLADYHKPTDTVDKINFDLMAKRAKLVFHTAWEI
ncbi:MAG TPA: M28 family peptidase, partial [Sediminibacterium sp.]|nr:M28 family peptidase [Sediminibacterium sp.]